MDLVSYMGPIKSGAINMVDNRSFKVRLAVIFIAALGLVLWLPLAQVTRASRASHVVSQTWRVHHLNNWIEFSYPSSFVSVNDGSPTMVLAGGALLNKTHTTYRILMGVAVDTNTYHTVNQVASQLLHAYKTAKVLHNSGSRYGRELVFSWPTGGTYTVYLAPFAHSIREIIINNEQSNQAYEPWITHFLRSVRNV